MKEKLFKLPALVFLLSGTCGYIISSSLFDELYFINFLLIAAFSLIFGLIAVFSRKLITTAFLFTGLSAGTLFYYYLWIPLLPAGDSYQHPQNAFVSGEVIESSTTKSGKQKLIVCGKLDPQYLDRMNDKRVTIITGSPHSFPIGAKVNAYGLFILPTNPNLPGEFDSKSYQLSQNISGLLLTSSIAYDLKDDWNTGSSFVEIATSSVDQLIDENLSSRHYPIVKAMLLGDKSAIDGEVRDAFSRSGTAHLLAVSGLHTGVIAFGIYLLLASVSNRPLRLLFFSITLAGFIVLSGLQASAIRAGIMAVLLLWAYSSERKVHALNLLSFAVILALLFQPELIFSIGFRMSVLAVLGIFLFYKRIFRRLKVLHFAWIKASIAVSLSSSVFLFPYIAYTFGSFSIVSPLANFFVVPLVTLSMVMSALAVVISFMFPFIGELLFYSVGFFLDLGLIANEWFASLSWAAIEGDKALAFSLLGLTAIIIWIMNGGLITRLSVAACGLFFYSVFLPQYGKLGFNRENIFYYEERIAGEKTIAALIDKSYSNRPQLDYGLLSYLEKRVGEFDTLIITGMHGMAITDRLKKIKQIEVIEIDIPRQKLLLHQANIPLFSTSVGVINKQE